MIRTLEQLPPLREVIAAYGLGARKSLGQNFLLDLNLTSKIARAAGDLSSCTIVEVGPGPGGLTRSLLKEGAKKVIAIEQDGRCVKALQPLIEASEGRLTVHHGDALNFPLDALESEAPLKLVANLPYNIATPLLIGWLRQAKPISSMVLMFQREVAQRITAAPGGKNYGRLSVISQARAQCRKLFDIPPQAFTPSPKVVSRVVEFIPFPEETFDFEALEALTKAAFGQRRKMLHSSLKPLFPDPEEVLKNIPLSADKRAEEVSVAQFIQLSGFIKRTSGTP